MALATDRIFMADGRFGWIVLQKSFCIDDQKFQRSQARLSCKDVRDLVA